MIEFKLDAKKKRAWVDALRGGDYKQDTCGLKMSGGFCCMGVYAEIFPGTALPTNDFLSTEEIPAEIQSDLAKMNDDEFLPFDEIATWIEANL